MLKAHQNYCVQLGVASFVWDIFFTTINQG